MKFFFIAVLLVGTSCSKEYSCESCVGQTIRRNATIIYTGSPAADGCDWLVVVDTAHSYHPDMLDSAFQQHQLTVQITFEITSDIYSCGLSAQIPIIHVIDIKR